ncbi:MAG TPA: LysE family transporter [Flavobacterium sp.]|nr:LysE family transporter [Flavobacterium sp.]
MSFLLPFFTGFLAAVLGTLLPGILNANVVKISKEEGIKNAYNFMLGTFVVIALQTYLAVFFARIIDQSVFITGILREIGFVIFSILTIYFFSTKSKKKLTTETNTSFTKRKRFFYGMFLALLNIFPVFYYVFITISVLNNNFYEVYYLSNILLTLGVILGTYVVFSSYIQVFKKSDVEENFILKNIDKIIGSITGIIAIFNLYKMIGS